MKEGGGPKAEQIVLNFFVPIRGGGGGGSMILGQNPQILLFFFLKASLRLLSVGKCLVLKRQTKCTARFNAILSTDLALYPVMIMFLSFCF